MAKQSEGKRIGAAVIADSERETVARLAYELYERRGRADGHDVEDWVEAEAALRGRYNGRQAARGTAAGRPEPRGG